MGRAPGHQPQPGPRCPFPVAVNGFIIENNRETVYTRDEKEFDLSQDEDCSLEDSASESSEELLQRSMIFIFSKGFFFQGHTQGIRKFPD